MSYCDPRTFNIPSIYHQNQHQNLPMLHKPTDNLHYTLQNHVDRLQYNHHHPPPPPPSRIPTKPYPQDDGYKKYDLKSDAFPSQPLRGNQDRDYYLSLKLEPRSPHPPKHTYATILAYAILHAPDHKMTLDQIYTWLLDHFPYFETCDKDWRNSIRHNLSLNVMFERIPRQITELGKGSYWTCRPENTKRSELLSSNPSSSARSSRRPSRTKPYLDSITGNFHHPHPHPHHPFSTTTPNNSAHPNLTPNPNFFTTSHPDNLLPPYPYLYQNPSHPSHPNPNPNPNPSHSNLNPSHHNPQPPQLPPSSLPFQPSPTFPPPPPLTTSNSTTTNSLNQSHQPTHHPHHHPHPSQPQAYPYHFTTNPTPILHQQQQQHQPW